MTGSAWNLLAGLLVRPLYSPRGEAVPVTDAMFQFGEFELDCERFELRRKGLPLRLERKPLELLILLASADGRLVSRDEIAHHLWKGEVFVDTEHGINTAIRKIRHALRDDPDHPRFLQTVTGKGYRFVGASPKPEPLPTPEQPTQPEPPVPQPVVPTRPIETGRRQVWFAGSVAAVLVAVVWLLTMGARRVRGHTAPPRINPAAIEAYQHAQYLWFSNNQGGSGEYFLKATQLAPNYAPAWAGLASFYGAQVVVGVLDPRENLPVQDAAAHRAVQLDDNLPNSHLSLAASDWLVNWDYPSALKELDRALQLDPKYTEAHHLRAKLLGQLNRHDEALAEQRIAMQINPFERRWALGFALLLARRYDATIAEAHARLEGNPDPHCWFQLAFAYRAKGMQNESESALEQGYTLSGRAPAAQALHRAYARGGARAASLWQLADLKSQSEKHYVPPFRFAELYAALGENQQALDALDETVRQHSPMIFDLQNESLFDGLHSDPHYRAIVKRIGLPPAY